MSTLCGAGARIIFFQTRGTAAGSRASDTHSFIVSVIAGRLSCYSEKSVTSD